MRKVNKVCMHVCMFNIKFIKLNYLFIRLIACVASVSSERKPIALFLAGNACYTGYSIKRPGRLLNFSTLRVGAYWRWALVRGWALIKFSPFSASSKLILQQNNK